MDPIFGESLSPFWSPRPLVTMEGTVSGLSQKKSLVFIYSWGQRDLVNLSSLRDFLKVSGHYPLSVIVSEKA